MVLRGLLCVAGMATAACGAPPAERVLPVGQWVWSQADAPLVAELRGRRPDAVAGVHVATVRFDAERGTLAVDLSLSPAVVPGPVALVIRLDDSVNSAWDADPTLGDDLDAAIGRVVAMARGAVPSWVEVQLDYDVPVRRIGAWAAVLGRLRRPAADGAGGAGGAGAGALVGQHVWVTSLVAHLRDPAYGDVMRGVVDGHVLQVFDTGDGSADAVEIARLAARAAMPYRLGVGAFERAGADGAARTSHRAWFDAAEVACPAPACEALWVFPAGRSYVALVP